MRNEEWRRESLRILEDYIPTVFPIKEIRKDFNNHS